MSYEHNALSHADTMAGIMNEEYDEFFRPGGWSDGLAKRFMSSRLFLMYILQRSLDLGLEPDHLETVGREFAKSPLSVFMQGSLSSSAHGPAAFQLTERILREKARNSLLRTRIAEMILRLQSRHEGDE